MSIPTQYKIALSLIPNVGPLLARKLVAYTGSVEAIFKEKKSSLSKVPDIGENIIRNINQAEILHKAEQELSHMQKNNIHSLFYLDHEYPRRLKECEDSPVILFYKGRANFNAEKVISVVGTRRATDYGETLCQKMISGLANSLPGLVVVSGFAYGIDICAHKSAMDNGLVTQAVFGLGIEKIYPTVHKKYVNRLLEQGALISEFPSTQKADPGNFVSRNRIIAGLADATIVVESGKKGGSLLTADMALSYNRDVFAFPGRVDDANSAGCNNLIKQNGAALIESTEDLIMAMKWDQSIQEKPIQKSLFMQLNKEEQLVVDLLKEQDSVTIDLMARALKVPVSSLSPILLKLEFDGVVTPLPGKNYKLRL